MTNARPDRDHPINLREYGICAGCGLEIFRLVVLQEDRLRGIDTLAGRFVDDPDVGWLHSRTGDAECAS
jgi:hypothetical protein